VSFEHRGLVAGGNLTRAQVHGLQQHAVELVHAWPCKTARELATVSPLCAEDPRVLNRRLSEVEKQGLLVRGPTRRCEVTGRKAATWLPPKLAPKHEPANAVVAYSATCMDCDRNTVRREGGSRLQQCPDCGKRLLVRRTTDTPDPRELEARANRAARAAARATLAPRATANRPGKEVGREAHADVH